jgi:phage major head subunit gpT-like protein
MGSPTFYMPSAVGDRASFNLVACFDEGVKDGINQIWSFTDGIAPVRLPNLFEVVRVVPSDAAENVYTYAGSDYEMSETSGDERPEYADALYEQVIANGRYKKRSLKIDVVDWQDDKIGKYRVKFHAAGTASLVKPYRYLANTIRTGKSNGLGAALVSSIDGRAFYGTHYAVPNDTTSPQLINDYVRPGGLDAPTFAEMWGKMIQFPGEDGQIVGTRPNILCCGPMDIDAAIDIAYLERPSDKGGGQNRFRGRVEVCFVPEWTDGTWCLMDTNNSLERGWIFQEREANRLFPLTTNPSDPVAIRQGFLDWQLQGRWEVGMGHYRRILRVRRS